MPKEIIKTKTSSEDLYSLQKSVDISLETYKYFNKINKVSKCKTIGVQLA